MNDLVATAEAPSLATCAEGLRIVGPALVVARGVQDESWLTGIAGGASAATDIAAFVIDPIASMAASAASFLMEYIGPLREALDSLAGSPARVTAQSQTWFNVSGRVTDTTEAYHAKVEGALDGWSGPAATAYQTFVASYGALVNGVSSVCTGIGYAMAGASAVVGFVRSIVRDTIADLVGKLVSWAIQVAATAGVGASWVVPRAVHTIAQYVEKVRSWIENLTTSIRNLCESVDMINRCLDDVVPVIARLRTSLDVPIFPSTGSRGLNSGMPHWSDAVPSGMSGGINGVENGAGTYDSSTRGQ